MNEQVKFGILNRNDDGIDKFYLHGYLDAHTAPDLENAISGSITRGSNKIIVNFSELDYISSAGLGVFMEFIEEIRAGGGDIKLTAMKPKVFSVFDLLGFPHLFDIVPEDEKAVEMFSKNELKKNEK